MKNTRVFKMPFAVIYQCYIQKAERKGRSKAEVDKIIFWLTGYDGQKLLKHINEETDLERFFRQAPRINPNALKIKGMICGYRIEELEDELMRQMRSLDKMVDELAKGNTMERILRN